MNSVCISRRLWSITNKMFFNHTHRKILCKLKGHIVSSMAAQVRRQWRCWWPVFAHTGVCVIWWPGLRGDNELALRRFGITVPLAFLIAVIKKQLGGGRGAFSYLIVQRDTVYHGRKGMARELGWGQGWRKWETRGPGSWLHCKCSQEAREMNTELSHFVLFIQSRNKPMKWVFLPQLTQSTNSL